MSARPLVRLRPAGGHADAGHEGYLPALPVAELARSEEPGDLGGLVGVRLAVAGRGPVLQPGQQVRPCSVGQIVVVAVDGGQVAMHTAPGARVLLDRQGDPSRARGVSGVEACRNAEWQRIAMQLAQRNCGHLARAVAQQWDQVFNDGSSIRVMSDCLRCRAADTRALMRQEWHGHRGEGIVAVLIEAEQCCRDLAGPARAGQGRPVDRSGGSVLPPPSPPGDGPDRG